MSILTIKNISKSYFLGDHKIEALKNISLTVNKGEFVGIVGASGSGKSTLLNLIGCLDTPDSGQVFINNQSFFDLNENERSAIRNTYLSYIFQSFHLVPVLNVIDNILLPLQLRTDLKKNEKIDICYEMLSFVGLKNYHNRKPYQLSGGQRQRVAIARALVTGAQIILADEPTANLDSKTAFEIIELMYSLNQSKNVTFVFCTHDDKLLSKLNRKILIRDGLCFE